MNKRMTLSALCTLSRGMLFTYYTCFCSGLTSITPLSGTPILKRRETRSNPRPSTTGRAPTRGTPHVVPSAPAHSCFAFLSYWTCKVNSGMLQSTQPPAPRWPGTQYSLSDFPSHLPTVEWTWASYFIPLKSS